VTHIKLPAKGVVTIMYWQNGALIQRAWQQSDDAPDWEPGDPDTLQGVGMKGGLVKVFE